MGRSKKGGRATSTSKLALSESDIVGTYAVEAIVGAESIPGTNGRRFMYEIQWYGYPGENTWEPLENIMPDCERLMDSFWRGIGTLDGKRDRIWKPSQEWIDAEVEYFRKTYVEPPCGTHKQRTVLYNEETGQMRVYDPPKARL